MAAAKAAHSGEGQAAGGASASGSSGPQQALYEARRSAGGRGEGGRARLRDRGVRARERRDGGLGARGRREHGRGGGGDEEGGEAGHRSGDVCGAQGGERVSKARVRRADSALPRAVALRARAGFRRPAPQERPQTAPGARGEIECANCALNRGSEVASEIRLGDPNPKTLAKSEIQTLA